MEILGKVLSEKTAQYIQEIEARLRKPVVYGFTDPKKTGSYGQCDAWQEDAYYVYSKEALFNAARKKEVNVPFETNLLHELSHLCQMEEGFPYTATASNDFTSQNRALYDQTGSIVSSSVLDLNVDFRLKQMGYTSEYFYRNRIIRADKIFTRMHGTDRIDDITFVWYACMFTCLNLVYQGPDMQHVMDLCREKTPALNRCVSYLITNIGQIGFTDHFSAFKTLVFLFDTFNVWISHFINYADHEFTSMDDVLKVYPDIRTWAAPPQA